MKDVLMKIKRNREQYDKRIQVLRHDVSFAPEVRRQRAEELWKEATEAHGKLLTEYQRKREETRKKLAERCFGLKFSPGTDPAERERAEAAYRQVLDRTCETAREKLLELLEEACGVGDMPTSLAITRCAYERGLLPVLDLATRLIPERSQALADLIDFEARWGKGLDDEIRFDIHTEKRAPQPPQI